MANGMAEAARGIASQRANWPPGNVEFAIWHHETKKFMLEYTEYWNFSTTNDKVTKFKKNYSKKYFSRGK